MNSGEVVDIVREVADVGGKSVDIPNGENKLDIKREAVGFTTTAPPARLGTLRVQIVG
jgi:hypothetical protein